jgi:glycosyltransferase involved in cell wall biosynthesis
MSTVCLIVPCFNEARRLDLKALANAPAGVTCLLVNDGSRDGTGELLDRHQSDVLRVLHLPHNVGKAEAIRQGVLHARQVGLLNHVEWVGYWDADLATPLSEVSNFLAYESLEPVRADGIVGSRIYKLGSRIARSYLRHFLGRWFATLARILLRLECYDSQCGAKLFRIEHVERAFSEPFISRWIFDVEVLMRLRERRLIECPLRTWSDVAGGKLNLLNVALPTLMDLLRIRRHYGIGRSTRG